MENSGNWEQSILINELIQGMELAKQLRVHLSSPSSSETRELLLHRILSSYDKALLILKWSGCGSTGQTQPVTGTAPTGAPESCISIEGSPRSVDNQEQRDVSKKRKVLPTWSDQVRVYSDNGLEGPSDDGYSWRKYGQKDILAAKYPRSYYRCTYRNIQSCWATKQVQRSDDDPTVFEITYRGKHTCNQVATRTVAAPASPEKQEQKQNHRHHHQTPPPQSNDILSTFRANLRVNTADLTDKAATSFCFPPPSFGFLPVDVAGTSYSPSFISPAISESNYFSGMDDGFDWVRNLQHSESDLTEIVSANASATNSPMGDLDFPIDPVDLDPNFPFDTPGFFA